MTETAPTYRAAPPALSGEDLTIWLDELAEAMRLYLERPDHDPAVYAIFCRVAAIIDALLSAHLDPQRH